ncbi:hypothetical protein Rs2_20320 [Raphanus sativus]|uniref:Chaperonin 60 subunit beta 2, chloroplastic n=1 Tax=Raphanus sativus TaxID=3726 RepID=A0A6J0NUU2_RAPSA|nr:chaperonin 60 subunit beta 2, chloroplastic [Raphanus sativus]KAJ4893526.1 hypothetical protein Rs2_20320 [Raphanus sativus]
MDAFERKYRSHGVNVTSEEEPVQNIGGKLARQAAAKTSDLAGHGVVLAQGFIDECVKVVAAGANPALITKGIEKTEKALVHELNLMSNAGNDPEAGSMIAEAMSKVGRNSVVVIDEGKSGENKFYVVEGMQFEPGYMSPYFITDHETHRMCVEYDHCKLLLVDHKVTNAKDLEGVLEDAIRGGDPIIIIAEDFEQEALDTLVVNKVREIWKVAAVKAPGGSGELKSQYLDDIAILTGATVIREEDGLSIDKAGKEVLGNAYKVVITKEMTTIVGDGTTHEGVNKRVAEIKSLIEQAEQDYEKKTLNERLAKLSGGVAVIQVGGQTETERREKKLRFEAVLNGTKGAVEESIVVGGGCTLLALAAKVDPIKYTLENEEEKVGADIIKKGLSNAGVDGSVVSEKVLKRSLEHAASAAKTFLMSEIKVPEAGNPMNISGWLLR